MNNKIEQDEIFTSVEPPISYYSSSSNNGVKAICSNREIQSYHKINQLFDHFSPNNNFSLCNTIMAPFILTEKIMEQDNNNYSRSINKSISIIKDKELNHISNTRNKTLSSKSENKENNDFLNNGRTRSNIHENNIITIEENPNFTGNKNLSTNVLINEKYKNVYDSDNNNQNNTSVNNNSVRIEGEFKEYLNKGHCKSININEINIKTSILKNANKKEKSQITLKKGKKAKIKDCYVQEKGSKKSKDINDEKTIKRKSFFFQGQSKSYIEEIKKDENNKKGKLRHMNCSTGMKSTKNYYYSNKMVNKNYNENFFKIIINNNNNNNKNDSNEGKEKDNKNKFKTERKKKKKDENNIRYKNYFKESHLSKNFKLKINDKLNHKESSHLKQGINILKERIKSKDQFTDMNMNLHNKSIKTVRDSIRKAKTRKIKKKTKEKEKNNKDSESEKKSKKNRATPNRRISGFTFNTLFKRRDSENDYSQSKTIKSIKMKSIRDQAKEKEKEKDISTKKNKKKCLSIKEIDSLKNNLDEKENVNKASAILRKKRSITHIMDKAKLKEVTDAIKAKKSVEDDTNYSLSTMSTNRMKKINQKKKFNFETALKNNLKKMQFNLFSKDKFTNTEFNDSDYLKYTLNCMELILELDIEKQTRLKNKVNFNFPKTKKKGIKKRIALFDLDETLVHCTGDINVKKEYQHAIEIKLPGKQAVQVGINLRPCWKQTLNLIKKHYHIVIYTASHQAYADAVLDFMDPKKKYFKYRLYRNNCSLIDIDGAKFYVKDLDILNQYYDLKDIVIVDNSVLSFAYHLHNGIPIVPYYDEDKDGSLYVVGLYLMHIYPEDDLREANKKQINLDSFLEEAKKEQENIIDEESDDEEENSLSSDKRDNTDEKKGDTKDKILENLKKKSDKKIKRIRKRFCSHGPIYKRREKHDLTQKKLMSQSKLIKMYYEVNDEKNKLAQDKPNESNEDSKKSNVFINKSKTLTFDSNENDKNSFAPESADFDCKSDPGNPLFDLNKNSNGESGTDDEDKILKRGYTIIGDDYSDNNSTKNLKGKLTFIRSNFYNKFKI